MLSANAGHSQHLTERLRKKDSECEINRTGPMDVPAVDLGPVLPREKASSSPVRVDDQGLCFLLLFSLFILFEYFSRSQVID
jgi:hypothetical protein